MRFQSSRSRFHCIQHVMKLDPNEGLTNTIKKTETRMHINAIDQLMRRGTKETNNNHSPNTPLVPEAHEPPTRPTKPVT